MNYQIKIIDRSQVPSDIYLCGENNTKDFRHIHLFEFNNGFKYVIGSYNRINYIEEIIEYIEFDFRVVTEYNNSPDELQQYYKNEFDLFYTYKICEKIWNHYYNNKLLIQEIINYYTRNTEEDEGICEEN